MRTSVSKSALLGLQVSLGLVIFAQAAFLAFRPAPIQAFAKTGLPDWVRIVLAWSEMLFALLFLVPRAIFVAGWGLLLVLVFAAGLHVLHGRMDVGALVIYAAAVLVIVSRE
jgi:predicted ferric reductase